MIFCSFCKSFFFCSFCKSFFLTPHYHSNYLLDRQHICNSHRAFIAMWFLQLPHRSVLACCFLCGLRSSVTYVNCLFGVKVVTINPFAFLSSSWFQEHRMHILWFLHNLLWKTLITIHTTCLLEWTMMGHGWCITNPAWAQTNSRMLSSRCCLHFIKPHLGFTPGFLSFHIFTRHFTRSGLLMTFMHFWLAINIIGAYPSTQSRD